MLFYVFYYIVAVVLVFQGAQALGEQKAPLGVVPSEVSQRPHLARTWGLLLLNCGGLAAGLGLLSHLFLGIYRILDLVQALCLGCVGAYGLYILFANRKVAYLGKPSRPAHH